MSTTEMCPSTPWDDLKEVKLRRLLRRSNTPRVLTRTTLQANILRHRVMLLHDPPVLPLPRKLVCWSFRTTWRSGACSASSRRTRTRTPSCMLFTSSNFSLLLLSHLDLVARTPTAATHFPQSHSRPRWALFPSSARASRQPSTRAPRTLRKLLRTVKSVDLIRWLLIAVLMLPRFLIAAALAPLSALPVPT